MIITTTSWTGSVGILSPREVLQAYLEAEIARFLYFSNYFLSHRRSSGTRATVIPVSVYLSPRDLAEPFNNTKARVVDERLSATNAVTAITCPANVLTLSGLEDRMDPEDKIYTKKEKKNSGRRCSLSSTS